MIYLISFMSSRKDLVQELCLFLFVNFRCTHCSSCRCSSSIVSDILFQEESQTRINEAPYSIILMFLLSKVVLSIWSITLDSLFDSLVRERSKLLYSDDGDVLYKTKFTSLFVSSLLFLSS